MRRRRVHVAEGRTGYAVGCLAAGSGVPGSGASAWWVAASGGAGTMGDLGGKSLRVRASRGAEGAGEPFGAGASGEPSDAGASEDPFGAVASREPSDAGASEEPFGAGASGEPSGAGATEGTVAVEERSHHRGPEPSGDAAEPGSREALERRSLPGQPEGGQAVAEWHSCLSC